jgi:CopG family transcriptional regulator/antitoxin EndoAI
MRRRINITLPEETLDLIDRVAKPGDRSNLIDLAVRHYVDSVGQARLRRRLKEGAQRRAERDLALASDWFSLEEEVWSGRRG